MRPPPVGSPAASIWNVREIFVEISPRVRYMYGIEWCCFFSETTLNLLKYKNLQQYTIFRTKLLDRPLHVGYCFFALDVRGW